jgi:hypothetical protein
MTLNGFVAQLVEQRTENPCVGSSILPEAIYIFLKSHHSIINSLPDNYLDEKNFSFLKNFSIYKTDFSFTELFFMQTKSIYKIIFYFLKYTIKFCITLIISTDCKIQKDSPLHAISFIREKFNLIESSSA